MNFKKNYYLFKDIFQRAKIEKFAIGCYNFNNFHQVKTLLIVANETKTPLILAISQKTYLYLKLDFEVIKLIIDNLIKNLNITIPVLIHFDHGQDFFLVIQALKAGFESVMYDGSKQDITTNIENTKKLLAFRKAHNIKAFIEIEIGHVAGKKDDFLRKQSGVLCKLEDVKKMKQLDVDLIAVSINNIHGTYPKDWKGLDFQLLTKINLLCPKKILVLHGGSGIEEKQIKMAIAHGIIKLNIGSILSKNYLEMLQKYFLLKFHLRYFGYKLRTVNSYTDQGLQKLFITFSKQFNCFQKLKS